MNVELKFKKLDDLRPEQVVQQVEPLRKLFEARQRLNDLLAKLDGNDELDALLQDVVANTDAQQQIKAAVEGGYQWLTKPMHQAGRRQPPQRPRREGSLLDQIISKGKLARDEEQAPRAKDLVGEFVHQILDEGMTVSRDTWP